MAKNKDGALAAAVVGREPSAEVQEGRSPSPGARLGWPGPGRVLMGTHAHTYTHTHTHRGSEWERERERQGEREGGWDGRGGRLTHI